jgi:hypothetical protein
VPVSAITVVPSFAACTDTSDVDVHRQDSKTTCGKHKPKDDVKTVAINGDVKTVAINGDVKTVATSGDVKTVATSGAASGGGGEGGKSVPGSVKKKRARSDDERDVDSDVDNDRSTKKIRNDPFSTRLSSSLPKSSSPSSSSSSRSLLSTNSTSSTIATLPPPKPAAPSDEVGKALSTIPWCVETQDNLSGEFTLQCPVRTLRKTAKRLQWSSEDAETGLAEPLVVSSIPKNKKHMGRFNAPTWRVYVPILQTGKQAGLVGLTCRLDKQHRNITSMSAPDFVLLLV